jgi:hypothetical protein
MKKESINKYLDKFVSYLPIITIVIALTLIITQPYEVTELLFKQVFKFGLLFLLVLVINSFFIKSDWIGVLSLAGILFYTTIFFGSILILAGSNFLGFDFASPKKYIVFSNCNNETIEFEFDKRKYKLKEREVLVRRRNKEYINVTNPKTSSLEKVNFVDGINVVVYGDNCEVRIREILGPAKLKLSYSSPGYNYNDLESVSNAVAHFPYKNKLDIRFFMPEEIIPQEVRVSRKSLMDKSEFKIFKIILE